jgi:hypothetical protein
MVAHSMPTQSAAAAAAAAAARNDSNPTPTPHPQAVLPYLHPSDVQAARLACRNWRLTLSAGISELHLPLGFLAGRGAVSTLRRAGKGFPALKALQLRHANGWCDPVQVRGAGCAFKCVGAGGGCLRGWGRRFASELRKGEGRGGDLVQGNLARALCGRRHPIHQSILPNPPTNPFNV